MTRSKARETQFLQQDDPFTEDTGQAGPFLPVHDEFATEMIKLVQEQLVEGVKRARKKHRNQWTAKQKRSFKNTGDIYNYNSYKHYTSTYEGPLTEIPEPLDRSSSSSELLEPLSDSGDSDDSSPDSEDTVRSRSPPADPPAHRVARVRPPIPPAAPPQVHTPVQRAKPETPKEKTPNSPAVDYFAQLLDLGTPTGARPKARPAQQELDQFLNLTSPELNRKAKDLKTRWEENLKTAVEAEPSKPQAKARDPFAIPADPFARSSRLTRSPTRQAQEPPKQPKVQPKDQDPFRIPADPFAKSSRMTRSPTRQAAATTDPADPFMIAADPFAKSSRLTRSPTKTPATSTRSKSSAPDIALPKVPDRKSVV